MERRHLEDGGDPRRNRSSETLEGGEETEGARDCAGSWGIVCYAGERQQLDSKIGSAEAGRELEELC